MPIEKTNPTILRKLDTGWDSIPREAIDSLESGEAIAIYTILITRPHNWRVSKTWIKNRTGFGDDRYKKGVDELKRKGFWTTAQVRGEDGRMQGKVIWLSALPKYPKTELRDSSIIGETQPLNNKESLNNKEGDYKALPNGINVEAWTEFEQHRKEIRKPLTDLARTKNLNILANLTHEQQQLAVDQTIANRWTGIFPPKEKSNGANRQTNLSAADRVRIANERILNA